MGDQKFILRDARDTLIDLLLSPLGTTFPIADLPVEAKDPTVLYNNPARIIISSIQSDVDYVMMDDNDKKYDNGIIDYDNGKISFDTNLLTKQDYTFNIIATKKDTGLTRQLLQNVTVKTGVNEGLKTSLKQPIFDYGTPATIIVEGAQSGAKYQLKDLNDNPLSEQQPIGEEVLIEGADLELVTTAPVKEDMTVKVTIVNVKYATPGTLKQKPIIRVAPNILTPVLESAVVDYDGKGLIVLNDTQTSAEYQVMFADIDLDEKPLINTPMGDPLKGTGGLQRLPVGPLQEDTEVFVVAKKGPTADTVKAAKDAGTIIDDNFKEFPTRIWIMVRPATKELSVVEETVNAGEGATIRVLNTQRGILYQLRTHPNNAEVGTPAYHHKNYGIGKARIGIEFAIDTFDKDYVDLPTGILNRTTTFNVLAIKATTRQQVMAGKIKVEVK